MRASVVTCALVALAGCGGGSPPASPKPAPAAPSKPDDAPTRDAKDAPKEAEPEKPAPPPLPDVSLAIVERAKGKKAASLRLDAPTEGQVVPAAKLASTFVKVTAKGLDGGVPCVSVDARPCVEVGDVAKGLAMSELGDLAPGHHVLVVLGRGAAGEVLPGKGAVGSFFVEKKDKPIWKRGDPVLVPVFGRAGGPDRGIDYFVVNAEIAPGKFLVQVGIVGPGISAAESVDDGRALKVVNARKGAHTVRLALARYSAELGPSGATTTVKYTSKTLVGPLVDVSRTLRVD